MNKNILVVDDEKENRSLLNTILNNSGFSCECVTDNAAALQLFRRKKYDIVLMNILLPGTNIPGVDGIEGMKIMKKLYPEIPIIAVTVYSHADYREKFIEEGFDDYIPKPFNFKILDDLLNSYLEQ
ncbi:MAG: response regulator [bacterium]|nr:response regulator [bacterium]